MDTYNYQTHSRTILGDLHTPVSTYLKVRDVFPQSALMESSDYHGSENNRSFIGLCPLASVSIDHGTAIFRLPDGTREERPITPEYPVEKALEDFLGRFHVEGEYANYCGLYGYTSFNAVRYFENIPVKDSREATNDAPDMLYILYQYLIVFNDFKNEMVLLEMLAPGEESELDTVQKAINNRNYTAYDFRAVVTPLYKQRQQRRLTVLIVIIIALALALTVVTGTLSASLALLGDAVDSASLYLNRADGGWPTTTGITEPLQIEPLADGFVELGNEDVLVYSAYGSKILSLQPSYARPVLAVGGTHFVVYNRAGSELTVCSRTRTLYTQRFDEDILLCAMSNNNSLAVVTDADRFAGWVHIYDPSMRELYNWRMPQSMGTPIALDFAPDNRRFASGMIAARDGQLNCSVYFMSLDSDTEGLLYTADAGSMLLRLDWQSENRVMAVFDTYIAVIDPRTAAEVARYDYGGAVLQSVAPGRRQTALLLNVHGGNSLVTLSESLTVMSEIPARQAFAVSATDTDIYLLCPDAVECYGYDGVQNWVQTGLPSRPLAVLHGKQTLVFTGSQADVLAKPAE